MQVKTGSYTGNGVDTRGITGIGFQPHVVIVKRMNGADGAMFRTANMAAGKSMTLRNDAGVVDNCIESLDSDGFTVGTDNTVNLNTATYTYIALRDNGSGDFKYGTYTGNGSDNRSITGVGFQPNWIVIKGDGGRTGCFRSGTVTGDKTHAFYSTGTQTDQIQAIETDGFQIGTSDFVNANSRTYYYFAFKEVADFCESFSYTGNGSDNRDITTPGFQPGLVWLKQEDGSDPRFRTSGHSGDASQSFDATQEANSIQGFISTGFTVGNNSQVNQSTKTYHVLALKDGTSASSNATPSAITSTLAVLAPVVIGAAAVAASLLTGTATVRAPVLAGGANVAPSAITTTVAIQAPTIIGAANVSPNALSGSFTLQTPSVSGGGTNVLPNEVTTALTVQSATARGAAAISPNALNGTLAVQPPTVTGAGNVSPVALGLASSVQSPTTTGAANISPARIDATIAVQSPTVSAPVNVNPTPLSGTLTILSPTVTGAAQVNADAQTLSAGVRTPVAGVAAEVLASTQDVSISVQAPLVIVGTFNYWTTPSQTASHWVPPSTNTNNWSTPNVSQSPTWH